MVDKDALLEPINFLVLDATAPRMFAVLMDVVKVKQLPVKLMGDAAILNPLLALSREDEEAFDRVVALIDSKRAKRGWPPLKTDEKFDRNEYQRDFMYQKRVRERRAADIENMNRTDRTRLIGTKRIEYMRTISNRWKKRRDELLDAERKRLDGTMPLETMRSLLEQFWARVDEELDALEAEARRQMMK